MSKIKFIEVKATSSSFSNRKPVFGVGINDAWYMVYGKNINGKRSRCRYYQTWSNILMRCYCEGLRWKWPTYKECTVAKEWLVFSNFKSWMEKQDWEGKVLDKDLKIAGNKVYGPDGCVFISADLNKLLGSRDADRGEWPIGVIFHKASNKFRAACSDSGIKIWLGLFDNPEDAHDAYVKYKCNLIKSVIPKNPELKSGLEHAVYKLQKGEV